ncbi:monosaccharide-sensing protein 2 [Selaginella moellendorffii]|uniref:monosaccharide-sensing protein 2 n=1 Tax=Selaginella moellendorffii TaxID=88036 RepID=UPI000D1CE265|nr:monosaccharide-sensing protein 2 [Selaginella moellendorffii]XP_024530908.1 monosaccharide-sensing protein 2 [Selaginella moellendorffii]|eukprot:XP_024530907.1 monosaccharide-sensing protein 2 [Selaginella moellendorffii]
MQPATLVALAATVVNMLQGWDTGAIGGALLYFKPELHLSATMEGLVVAASLAGAWCSTLCAGAAADRYGRQKILFISSIIFVTSSCIMAWTPNIYVLLLARLLLGAGVGLITTIAPMYIAEIAPTENRGQLLTFPQLMGSTGQFLCYVLVFLMSLSHHPMWRYMLGMLFVPAMVNFTLALFYIPESPRWLVSKGRMVEAKKVLQRLRNTKDVTAELALLVEGLNIGETTLEEWQLKPVELGGSTASLKLGSFRGNSKMMQEGNVSWIATSATGGGGGFLSRRASMVSSLRDPVVTLFGSMHNSTHDHLPVVPAVFGTFRSTHDHLPEPQTELMHDNWDQDEGPKTPQGNGYQSDDGMVGNLDENLSTPLLNPARSGKFDASPWSIAGTPRDQRPSQGSFADHHYHDNTSRQNINFPRGSKDANESSMYGRQSAYSIAASVPESIASVGIGGGWQLAWQWTGTEGQENNPDDHGQFKRVFLLQHQADQHQQQQHPQGFSSISLPHGEEIEAIQAAALVTQASQYSKHMEDEHPVGPAMVHPAETAVQGVAWSDLLEIGVRRALTVGILLQVLQQFSGINAVQAFVPQILSQSGASALLTSLGLGTNSASILASTFSSLLTLPCIIFAMKIMDRAGRRQLLLVTLPILFVALITIATSNLLLSQGVVQAAGSFGGVLIYICTFVMGFGAIPNIICSEIFPTRVRGVCIGLCQTAFWTCNILITNLFPTLLQAIGVGGIFGLFSLVVLCSWVFVYLKVPETKGMPLEVISEFFAMASVKQA